jgi:hypothetical protein
VEVWNFHVSQLDMSQSSEISECQPLVEACNLHLYEKNIFRITGLPVDATPKEVARQAQRLQMLEDIGSGTPTTAAFPLNPAPTAEQIRAALARMKEPEHRLVDEFFWYWPETFGKSEKDPAMQALLAGNGQQALDLWTEREGNGSIVARHNLAVMFHMYAVDWTNHQLVYEIEPARAEKIKGHWKDASGHLELLADSDEMWDIVKGRVKALEDEALTLGFVRRMRKLLPQALDRINAEAALKFAELGNMDWAEYHVDLMRQTHQGLDDVDATAELVLAPTKKRVKQRLEAARERYKKDPEQGVDLAKDLMNHCRPLMALFDLFHGAESHHRADLFDEVAEVVLNALVGYQKTTGDNKTIAGILQQSLLFASGSQLRERIVENISAVQNNILFQLVEPYFKYLSSIEKSGLPPQDKLARIKNKVLAHLPGLVAKVGADSELYTQLADSIAIVLRAISIDAHNEHHDYATADEAIKIAGKLAVDVNLRSKIATDVATLSSNALQRKLIQNQMARKSKNEKMGCFLVIIFIAAGAIIGGLGGAFFGFIVGAPFYNYFSDK